MKVTLQASGLQETKVAENNGLKLVLRTESVIRKYSEHAWSQII